MTTANTCIDLKQMDERKREVVQVKDAKLDWRKATPKRFKEHTLWLRSPKQEI